MKKTRSSYTISELGKAIDLTIAFPNSYVSTTVGTSRIIGKVRVRLPTAQQPQTKEKYYDLP